MTTNTYAENEIERLVCELFDVGRDVWVETWSVLDPVRLSAGRPTSGDNDLDLELAKEKMLVSLPISEIAMRLARGAKPDFRSADTVIAVYETVCRYLDTRYRVTRNSVHNTAISLEDVATLDQLCAYLNNQYWTAKELQNGKRGSPFSGKGMLGSLIKAVNAQADADKPKEPVEPVAHPAYRHRLPEFSKLQAYADENIQRWHAEAQERAAEKDSEEPVPINATLVYEL
jgi:hypothetical protein